MKKNFRASNRASKNRRPIEPNSQRSLRLAVGYHSVFEALKAHPEKVTQILISTKIERLQSQKWVDLFAIAKKLKVEVVEYDKSKKEMPLSANESVSAYVDGFPKLNWEHLASTDRQMVCLLDGVQDPHNLGAILRSAWLLGAKAIFMPHDRSCPLTAVVSKVSCGGLEWVPVERTLFSQLIEQLRTEMGFWIYGLDGRAEKSLWQVNLPEKVAWVIGAEGSGLKKSVLRSCDELVSIPQLSKDASLNASVSAALAFAEFARPSKIL